MRRIYKAKVKLKFGSAMRKANFVENVRELRIAVLTGTTDIEGYNKYIASKNVSSFFVAYFRFVFVFSLFCFCLLFTQIIHCIMVLKLSILP